jgi:Flp pilus assembly protein TadG
MSHSKMIKNILKDRRGTALLETALIFPVMVGLWLGGVEIGYYINANSALSRAAASMAKMVAQDQSVITPGVLVDMCTGMQMTIYPMANSTLSVDVASVTYQSDGTKTLDWEGTKACPTQATAMGSTAITLATTKGVIPNLSNSTIMVKVSMTYTSPIQFYIQGNRVLTATVYARPRGTGTTISSTCSASNPC